MLAIRSTTASWVFVGVLTALAATLWTVDGAYSSADLAPTSVSSVPMAPDAPAHQSVGQAHDKSAGCESCHSGMDSPKDGVAKDHRSMHANPGVVLGCTDCHGGNAAVHKPANATAGDATYRAAETTAHVLPRNPLQWKYPSSANPPSSFAQLNRESPAFIRFVNPGDLRVARNACGACHLSVIQAQERSLMATSAMLWGGASYNTASCPSSATAWVSRTPPRVSRP